MPKIDLQLPEITAAIDPGKHGAVAALIGGRVFTFDCPQEELELISMLRRLNISEVVLENVGQARSGNGLVSAVNFARHCQMLQSTLKVAGYKVVLVAPSKWIPAFLGADRVPFPMDLHAFSRLDPKAKKRVEAQHKRVRKKKIQEKVLTISGDSVSLNHADAVALLLYHKGEHKPCQDSLPPPTRGPSTGPLLFASSRLKPRSAMPSAGSSKGSPPGPRP